MSNELIKKQDLMPTSVADVQALGKLFFESGLFVDIKSAAQASIRIMAGQEIGIPPFAAMAGIFIIKGKTTIGAGIMAAAVKGSGKYDYKVIQQDEKACSIDFYQGKDKIGNSTFTMEDAKKAQTQNLDKFPRNMLFARAISNGVKWYTPDIFNGPVYVPEEMEQVTEDIPHQEIPADPTPPAPEKKRLTDKAVIQAVARINGGETTLKANILEAYDLTPEQLAMIESAEPQNPQA